MSENIKVITVTPTVDTNAYTSGDRCGTILTLPNVTANPGDGVVLEQVAVISKVAITTPIFAFMIFDDLPTVASADNAAIDVSDAEMAAKFLGTVITVTGQTLAVASGTTTASSTANMKSFQLKAGSTTLYAVTVVQAAPTFTSTTDLTIRFFFRRFSRNNFS